MLRQARADGAAIAGICAGVRVLADAGLLEVDSLYLPGGYPELHLRQLADNRSMLDAIRAHHAAGKPVA